MKHFRNSWGKSSKAAIQLMLVTIMVATLLVAAIPAAEIWHMASFAGTDKVGPDALKLCRDMAFSTEEDFITQGPEPPDGNPIISDGDLLGPSCAVCARNYDLLHNTFDIELDLGLDAVDVIDVDLYLVALSTELDSPNPGQFTAGDLLATNGTVIPNIALLSKFGLPQADLGLDAVHFTGEKEDIVAFLDYASQVPRGFWLEEPSRLPAVLAEKGIDIWFSTEGTAPTPEAPALLDGDLLSARDGTIVAANSSLLPPSVPAGIPNRGVDFGLDAVTADRTGTQELIRFSTEILYQGVLGFTDGDILQYGTGVVVTNYDLIKCYVPKADFIGLDALSNPAVELCQPSIDVDKKVLDPENGEWVKIICAPIGDTVRFQCTIHNDGTCFDLSSISATDFLSESLQYADNATVNGVPWEPNPIGPSEYQWDFVDWVLEPSQSIIIEFDAVVGEWSAFPDINLMYVEAWCKNTGTSVSDLDEAAVQPFIPGDANMDGVVDVFDLVTVKRIILGLDPPTCGADANLDGTIDVFDLVKIKRIILGLD
jgi:uncharacterized repeat protein (TIGR01451 family)